MGILDLSKVGQRYGRFEIIAFSHMKGRVSYWLVRCDCGASKTIARTHFSQGYRHCWCSKIGNPNPHPKPSMKPKYRPSPTRLSWSCMMRRCFGKNTQGYRLYGGRGITVCDRWRSFKNFLEDMGERPAGKTLDRINSNGNYEPSNCRWATPEQQANNMRTNVLFEFKGEQKTVTQWARIFGLAPKTIRYRIDNGIPLDAPRFGGEI